MTYQARMIELVNERREELEADLTHARTRRDAALAEVAAIERQIGMLEGLLALVAFPERADEGERVTLHAAMAKVLSTTPNRMMRAGDLAAAIERKGLYRMRDGRPVEQQQIHARVGHYPQLFAREGTFIKLM
jgi:hypothetical protein